MLFAGPAMHLFSVRETAHSARPALRVAISPGYRAKNGALADREATSGAFLGVRACGARSAVCTA
jgi:hypothetical protein